MRRLLAGDRTAHCEASAAFGATTCKDLASVSGRHSLTETMLVNSLSVRRLKCSFHCRILIFVLIIHNSECKFKQFFPSDQHSADIFIHTNRFTGYLKSIPLKNVLNRPRDNLLKYIIYSTFAPTKPTFRQL